MAQLDLFTEKDNTEENLIIVGLDEAGRGPLVGPVYAGAVVLPPDFPLELLNDSKKLTAAKRKEAEACIKEKALAWATAFATHNEIDSINILNASMLAMKRAYLKVAIILKEKGITIDRAYADGNKRPDLGIETIAVVKGDSKIPEIMAASILAKEERDRIMVLCSKKWPHYDFDKHKGYPTKKHAQAILTFGPSPIQRKSFHVPKIKHSTQGKLF